MKRIISGALVLVMLLSCFTGCGNNYNEKFIGKWEAAEMSVDGTVYEDYLGIPLNALFQFDIQDKGKGEWHSPMSGTTGSASEMLIKWEEADSDSIEVTAYIENDSDSEQSFRLEYKDGSLVMSEDGVEFYLKRVDSFTEYTQDELTNMLGNTMNSILTE